MKKLTLIFATATAITLYSCEKNEVGYVYKATHEYEKSRGGTGYATDFFHMPAKDDDAAWFHYKGTQAYMQISTWTDTTYIEYYCTAEEWKLRGEQGLMMDSGR